MSLSVQVVKKHSSTLTKLTTWKTITVHKPITKVGTTLLRISRSNTPRKISQTPFRGHKKKGSTLWHSWLIWPKLCINVWVQYHITVRNAPGNLHQNGLQAPPVPMTSGWMKFLSYSIGCVGRSLTLVCISVIKRSTLCRICCSAAKNNCRRVQSLTAEWTMSLSTNIIPFLHHR